MSKTPEKWHGESNRLPSDPFYIFGPDPESKDGYHTIIAKFDWYRGSDNDPKLKDAARKCRDQAIHDHNTAPALLAALKLCLDILEATCFCEEGKPTDPPHYCQAWPAKKAARTAIAAAEGE